MLQLVLSADALARSRFVVSPLHEVVATLLAWGHQPRPDAEPWLARARRVLRRERLPLLETFAVEHGGYVPDFLCPHPEGPAPTVEEQLAQVAATPPERVAAELEALHRGRPSSGLAARQLSPAARALLDQRGDHLAARAATELRRYWQLAFAPHWPRAQAVLEAEIGRQAQLLARHGSAALLGALHPQLRWDGQAVLIESRYHLTTEVPLLLLVPSLIAAGVGAAVDPAYGVEPRPPVIVYPVARHALPVPAPRADLGRLLGPSRAALLSSLRTPATTSELAASHFLSPATVSYHLGILLRSGLVTRERSGREVRYRRTGQGSRLMSGDR